MRKILFLAYHFPPIGGAGVQRNRRFVNYLPEFGYKPVIVTGPGTTDSRWTPMDASLLEEGPTVHRLPGAEPAPSSSWNERAERWLGLRTPQLEWWLEGSFELTREVARETELIFASLIPYETAETAARLSRALGKPWVADLQDPWALDEMWVYPTRVHRSIDLRRMRKLLGTAEAIVMNTPESAAKLVQAFPELGGKIVVSITNGFDASDFAGPPPERTDSAFRIVHTGSMHTARGERHRRTSLVKKILGGTAEDVDILTRSHVYLTEALDQLFAEKPELAELVELHLAGVLSDSDRAVAGHQPAVKLRGYLPHAETIGLIRSADLLFLPMQDLKPGTRASITPGKTYEYLASGLPILACVPDGDARELLEAVGTAILCRPPDMDSMKRIVREQVERFQRGESAPQSDESVLAQYERRALTRDLSAVFDQVLGSAAPATAASSRQAQT
jgi:glycosyltransferase involved in cell wall biosynthesis